MCFFLFELIWEKKDNNIIFILIEGFYQIFVQMWLGSGQFGQWGYVEIKL